MSDQEYHGSFKNWDDVTSHFEMSMSEPTLVWADYDLGGYDGSALIVYMNEGKWYQVNASHCSCYGLEDQFQPEEFDPDLHLAALNEGKRIVGYYHDNGIDEWLKRMLKRPSA